MPKAGIRSKEVFLLILIMFLLLSFNQGAVLADTNTPTPSPTVTGTLTSTPVNSMFEISNPYWHSNPVNQNYVANLVNDFWVSQPTGEFQDLYINYRRSGTNLSYGASSNGVGVRVFFPVRQQSGAQRPLYAVVQYRASHPNVKYEITGCCGGRTWTWTANSFSPPYIGEGMWQGWINIPNSASYQNTSFWIGYSSGAIPLNTNWWIELTIHLSDRPVTNPYTPTPTPTSTPTLTPIFTVTSSPTSLPAPNQFGSGTCWETWNSWGQYNADYSIDRVSIPAVFGWDTSIHAAAQTWTYVTPSHFVFSYSAASDNLVSLGAMQDSNHGAETYERDYILDYFRSITERDTVLNIDVTWDINNEPIEGNPNSNGSTTTANIQNIMTHEFGHWLDLYDLSAPVSCASITMWHETTYGDISRITLEDADKAAINWQYP